MHDERLWKGGREKGCSSLVVRACTRTPFLLYVHLSGFRMVSLFFMRGEALVQKAINFVGVGIHS